MTQRRNDIIAIIGLILGATLGIGGTLVSTDSLRQTFWIIDGVGLVVATSLLAVRFFRSGDDIAAAGFLVFALGESLLIAVTPRDWMRACRRSAVASRCGRLAC